MTSLAWWLMPGGHPIPKENRMLADAKRAVTEARRNIHELLITLPAWEADKAHALLDTLEAAIRDHDAELILDQNPDRDADFSAGVDWAADTIRHT